MFELWHSVHAFEPMCEVEVRREVLWCNQRISIASAPVKWRKWEGAGILTINDICHDNEDRILSHLEVEAKFGFRCSFLEMLHLRLSIPHAWRAMLSPNWVDPPNPGRRLGIELDLPGEERMDILFASSKHMYKALIHGMKHTSTAFLHWTHSQDPSIRVSGSEEWTDIARNVYRATRETKLQTLHFRILNRIVPCNAFLKRMKIKPSDACEQCGAEDTISHFFYGCSTVASFRQGVFARLEQGEDRYLDKLSEK